MSARDEILCSIRARRARTAPLPEPYSPPLVIDPVTAFAERARLANAEVQIVEDAQAVPAAIADLLRSRNLPARLCVPEIARDLPWSSAPGLTIESVAPGPEDTAIGVAQCAIAETGTLTYAAAADAPASWHFRAGFEIAVIDARDILPHMEDVLLLLKDSDGLPSTLNFVTGPSRTGDIEQTLELGAHGPKALAILIVKG
jgi:L-lactate dehydrogenase complex protein LldG